MKPLQITFTALTLIMGSEAKCQGLYFETNSSYNLSIGSQEIGQIESYNSNYNELTGSYNSSGNSKQIRGSYGKGAALGLSVGYMFNQTIGFEVKAEQQLSSSYEIKYSDVNTYTDIMGDTYSDNEYYTETYSGSMTKIIPSIIIQGGGEKLRPYAQVGAILGFGKIEGSYNYSNSSNTSKSRFVMNGGLALGINGEMGINYKLTEKLSLNAGLTFSGLSYAPAKGEVTEYTENGVDMLSGSTVNDREVEFVDEISYSSNSTSDPNKPDKSLKMWFPYSNAGLNIGLKFSL